MTYTSGLPQTFYFPEPPFPYLYKFPNVQGLGEKEIVKTQCIIPGQGGPSVTVALNKLQGGCEKPQGGFTGTVTEKVHLRQAQENY